MDRIDFVQGDAVLTDEAQNFREAAKVRSFQSLLSDYTSASLGFFLSGCSVSEVTNGSDVTVNIAAGHVSFNGEPLLIEADTIVRNVTEVAWLQVNEIAIDSTPTNNSEGVGRSVQMKRTMRLEKGSNYPAPSDHMKLDAPSQLDLLVQKLSGRVMQIGFIFEINPDNIPLVSANWTNTGLGQLGTPAEGLALCNGLNGTIDKRHLSSVGATLSAFSVGAGPFAAGVDSGNTYNAGDTFGADEVTLTEAQMPEHNHTYDDRGVVFNGANEFSTGSEGERVTTTGIGTGNAGGDEAHENRQPSIASVFVQVVS